MAAVTSIGGVFVRSSNPERLRSFYRDTLGLSVGSWGGATLPIVDGAGRQGYQMWVPLSDGSRYLYPSHRPFMINLRVDDLDSVVERATEGEAFLLPRHGTTAQGRYAYLVDPDGTLIELWEPDPTDPEIERLQAAGVAPAADHQIELRDGREPAVRIAATNSAPRGNAAVPVTVAALRTSGEQVRTVEVSTTVPVDAMTAWRSWVDETMLAQWWTVEEARVDLRIGGRYELLFQADGPAGLRGSEGSQIMSYVPGHTLAFTWNAPPHTEMRGILTWVSLIFAETGDGTTKVQVLHSGLGDGPHWAAYGKYLEGAWRRALHRLRRFYSDSPAVQAAQSVGDDGSVSPSRGSAEGSTPAVVGA